MPVNSVGIKSTCLLLCALIADSENHRIVVLEESDLSFVRIIENPTSDVLEENFVFTPLKVTVD